MTSSDGGQTWTLKEAALDIAWRDLTYGNGVFVAVSNAATPSNQRVMTSIDNGDNWTPIMTTDPGLDTLWRAVTYGNGCFVAVAGGPNPPDYGQAMYSTDDGQNWVLASSVPNTRRWFSVTFGNGLFVAVSNGVDLGSGLRATSSTDGDTWTSMTTPPDNPWTSVTYGDGQLVAVASTGDAQAMTTNEGALAQTCAPEIPPGQGNIFLSFDGLWYCADTYGSRVRRLGGADEMFDPEEAQEQLRWALQHFAELV